MLIFDSGTPRQNWVAWADSKLVMEVITNKILIPVTCRFRFSEKSGVLIRLKIGVFAL